MVSKNPRFWRRRLGGRSDAGATIHRMHPALEAALQEVDPLIADRGWARPSPSTLAAAERLLELVEKMPRQPALQVEPEGTISFEWEAAEHGWLTLTVDGRGGLAHSAVLGEDEFAQTEPFEDELPGWAGTLLQRLLASGH
jgi:hypothetical protein